MNFLTASINESPLISQTAGAALADVRGKAVKFDDTGKIALAGADDLAVGIAVVTNDEAIPAGDCVDVQIHAVGLAKAGGAITPGDALAPDANGALVAATEGPYIAVALQKGAAGEFVQVLVGRGYLPST